MRGKHFKLNFSIGKARWENHPQSQLFAQYSALNGDPAKVDTDVSYIEGCLHVGKSFLELQ